MPVQTNQDLTERVSLPSVARVLASVSTDLSLQAITLPVLLGLLETLAEQPFSQEHADLAGAVTGSMCRVVEKTVGTPEGLVLVHETAVNRVMMLCMGPSLATPLPTRHVCMEEAVLRNFLAALRTFTLAASSDPKYVYVCNCCTVVHCVLLISQDIRFLDCTHPSGLCREQLHTTSQWLFFSSSRGTCRMHMHVYIHLYTGSTVHACIQYVYIHVHCVLQLLNMLLQASSPHQQTQLVRMLTATLGAMTQQV